jgi:hypothetical protein
MELIVRSEPPGELESKSFARPSPSRVTTRVSLGMKTTAALGGSHCLPNPRGDFGSALWVLITPAGRAFLYRSHQGTRLFCWGNFRLPISKVSLDAMASTCCAVELSSTKILPVISEAS